MLILLTHRVIDYVLTALNDLVDTGTGHKFKLPAILVVQGSPRNNVEVFVADVSPEKELPSPDLDKVIAVRYRPY